MYHVVGRYHRRWIDEIVDDREEVVPPEKSFRFQKKVREKDMEPWTKEGALDPGSAFQHLLQKFMGSATSSRSTLLS